MGVLNVTPDSFSDGGRYLDPEIAVKHGLEMIEQGAEIIDVGGESTRPGATPVPEDEELRRVLPVIESLVAETEVAISIDTRKASVASKAVEAGAMIVNDTLGEESDGTIWRVAAETGAALVFMHSRGTPETMKSHAVYDDVVRDVKAYLEEAADRIEAAGVHSESLVLDPGIGFAKDARQNLQLLHRLDEIVALGYPVLAGTSRKSFIGAILDLPEDQRLEGTAATVAWAVAMGVRLVRVHDVAEMTRVVRMTEAIRDPGLA
jgi:dihydropteroate synthase